MSSAEQSGAGVYGQSGVSTLNARFNSNSFLIRQLLATVRTSALVLVKAVNGGGIASIGTVDIQPLVHQVDGVLNVFPHGIVHGLPFVRVQGGSCAFVCDPVVGDIGVAVFCDRDISVIKATAAAGAPGSRRRFSLSDGIYLLSAIAEAPTTYVEVTTAGVNIVDANGNVIQTSSSGIELTSELVSTSSVLQAGNGASGTFTSQDGKTITVADGIVTEIV